MIPETLILKSFKNGIWSHPYRCSFSKFQILSRNFGLRSEIQHLSCGTLPNYTTRLLQYRVICLQRFRKIELSVAIIWQTFDQFWIAIITPNFQLKYKNFENITTNCVGTVVFKLHPNKQRNFLPTQDIAYTIINFRNELDRKTFCLRDSFSNSYYLLQLL